MKLIITRRRKLAAAVVATLIGALALPAMVGAQGGDPTIDQYDPSVTQLEGETGLSEFSGGPGDPGDPSSSGLSTNVGPLPFTGFDVLMMVAVALAVAGLGLALQRAVSRSPGGDSGI